MDNAWGMSCRRLVLAHDPQASLCTLLGQVSGGQVEGRVVRPFHAQSGWVPCCAVLLVLCHTILVGYLAERWSPNIDEPAHLAGGMAIWQYGTFEVYCVNPPLMRSIAVLPILCMDHEDDWGEVKTRQGSYRQEFGLGQQFVDSHPEHWEHFLVAARWTLIPFSILGGVFCYCWATELYGRKAGLLALSLWCFSPNVLAWSAVLGTDMVAAALGVGAAYMYWRWLRTLSWSHVPCAGIALGLAELSKMTWIILFLLWPALWWWTTRRDKSRWNVRRQSLTQLAVILALGLYVLNLGYAFRGSMTPLAEYSFHSRLLAGENGWTDDDEGGGNRFAESWVGQIPLPVPRDYLRGLDLQRVDFERGMSSYLFGTWADRGWWYYYLVGMVCKVPLGTWGLVVLALFHGLVPRSSARSVAAAGREEPKVSSRDGESVLVITAFVLLLFVSSQYGFSKHFRYILPVFPFVFVWLSKVAQQTSLRKPFTNAVVIGCVLWSVGSSLATYPHSVSYFNEVVGGPRNGYRYMLNSSFSWNHELGYVRRWLQEHPEAEAPYMAVGRYLSLESLKIRSRGEPPKCLPGDVAREGVDPHRLGPVPGWHVMSLEQVLRRDGGYLYFRRFTPVAMIGYSTAIYHLEAEEVNRVRGQLGIPKLADEHVPPAQLIADLKAGSDAQTPLRVAIYSSDRDDADGPATELLAAVSSTRDISWTVVSAEDIREGKLRTHDVVLFPGGSGSAQGSDLGSHGREAVRQFVDSGGGYVGVCAGAYLATCKYDWSLGLVNARATTGERYVPGFGLRKASFRGSGDVTVELDANGLDVFGGDTTQVKMWYSGGPILSHADRIDLPEYVCLARFRSEVCKYPFQRGQMAASPAVIAAQFGSGKVLLFSPHPELEPTTTCLLARALRACARRSSRPDSP